MEKSTIPSLCWVPRGRSKFRPDPTEEGTEEDVASTDGPHAARAAAVASALRMRRGKKAVAAPPLASAASHGLEEFDMDNYDDGMDQGSQFFSVLNEDLPVAKAEDPYLDNAVDSEDEPDVIEIGPEDQVFVTASVQEDDNMLELYVYFEDDACTSVHHDIFLPAYPLCVQWLSAASGRGSARDGSFAAVGLLDGNIQVWDLDEAYPLRPATLLLGGPASAPPPADALETPAAPRGAKRPRRRTTASAARRKAHDGAVLCLHASPFNCSVLASGSADQTLKIWDVERNACVHTYEHHGDKVQVARWHPAEASMLLSASFDRKLFFVDVRQPEKALAAPLPDEAEAAVWSRHAPSECFAAVESGVVLAFDSRKVADKASEKRRLPLWSLQAHRAACTTVQDLPSRGLLVTAGLDSMAKVWRAESGAPTLLDEKDLQAGPLFTGQSCPEAPALMCFGGSCVVVWDLSCQPKLADALASESPEILKK